MSYRRMLQQHTNGACARACACACAGLCRSLIQPHDDLDKDSHVVDDITREAIDMVVLSLTQQHPTIFKPSSRCRIPHLNRSVARHTPL